MKRSSMICRVVIVILLPYLFVSGCATTAVSRDLSGFAATHPLLTAEERSEMENGQIGLGFTFDMVRYTLGKPDKIFYEDSLCPVWLYWRQDINPITQSQQMARQIQTSQQASQAFTAGNYGLGAGAILAGALASAAAATGAVTKLYFLDGVLVDQEYVSDVRLINLDAVSE